METRLLEPHLIDDSDAILAFPPGFEPFPATTSFQDNVLASAHTSDRVQAKMVEPVNMGNERHKKSLRNRPVVNYNVFDNSSDDDDSRHLSYEKKDSSLIRRLPKGVVRGCSECARCQKVTARWYPQDACRPLLDEAPIFYPSEEEFKDTLRYIARIRLEAEPYGICRIVPPSSWKPPCILQEKHVWENSEFTTRVQQVDKLQNRRSPKKPCKNHGMMKRKRRKIFRNEEEILKENEDNVRNVDKDSDNAERFGFEPGPTFALESFKKYADEFVHQYFQKEHLSGDLKSGQNKLSVESIEGEYWRIVERPTEEIEVLYGADLDTGEFGSGFPKASTLTDFSLEDQYVVSGWNLNNFPRLAGSVLSFEGGDISGVLVPWLYIGMCFSSFCWHVEDHHLYSLNYLHLGAPKIWYGIPGKDALKLEQAMKKHLPDLFEEQPDLLHNLVTQFSPSMLKLEGVPVYRCVQNAGEFVLTFPRAYHSGFNSGFNLAEAVNVAPVDWLPHGQIAVELYRLQKRKISISHDKLLLGAAREAVKAQWNSALLRKSKLNDSRWIDVCGLNGVLAKALKARIEMEQVNRELLRCLTQSRKMDSSFDTDIERECFLCHYDLHLSAVGCACSPEKFSCLGHAKDLCSCEWNTRLFLFRYEISELNTLADALGGKLSAVHRWGVSDLGLSLSASSSKNKLPESRPLNRSAIDGINKQEKELKQDNLGANAKKHAFSKDMKTTASDTCISCESVQITNMVVKASANEPSTLQPKVIATISEKDECQQHEPIQSCRSVEVLQKSCSGGPSGGFFRSSDYVDENALPNLEIASPSTDVTREPVQITKMVVKSSANEPSSLQTKVIATLSEKDECQQHEPFQSCRSVEVLQKSCSGGPSGEFFHSSDYVDENALPNLEIASPSADVTCEGDLKSHMTQVKCEALVDNTGTFSMLIEIEDDATCNFQDDQAVITPVTNASAMSEIDDDLLAKIDNLLDIEFVEIKDEMKDETFSTGSSSPQFLSTFSQHAHDSNYFVEVQDEKLVESLPVEKAVISGLPNTGTHLQQFSGNAKADCDGDVDKNGPVSIYNPSDRGQYVAMCSSSSISSLDRYTRSHKGPRMAKVVRRINCNVEPLDYGVVHFGNLWSTSQAIFPKGYKSRVRYFSILDPTQMCNYVSEIVDAGLLGPLFMVKVEACPCEVFFHTSPTKCWDLVRERVNLEIGKLHNMGRAHLPSLQPPGSLDGFEMFGFFSPTILQAIEALDHGRGCTEYWRFRSQAAGTSCPVKTEPASSLRVGAAGDADRTSLVAREKALFSLFKKAEPDELHALQRLLADDKPATRQRAARLLDSAIQSRR